MNRTVHACTSVVGDRPCGKPLVLHPFLNKSGSFDAVAVCRTCDGHPIWVNNQQTKAR